MEIIIYGSNYGTAKLYAEELSRLTGISVVSYDEIRDINVYDTIVYIGSLYAGGVLGLKKTFQKLQKPEKKRIFIATVGLADPEDEVNINNIRRSMGSQLSAELFMKADISHLRGKIDYSKLNLKHKTMMAMLYRKAIRIPDNKQNAELRSMINTYNKTADFVDFDSLYPIVAKL